MKKKINKIKIKKIAIKKMNLSEEAIEVAKYFGDYTNQIEEKPYKAILEMAGIKYKGEGDTLFEAMDAIKLDWQQIKAKGVFTITHGAKKCEKLFYLKPLKRIFANKITKIFWAKNLERLFK